MNLREWRKSKEFSQEVLGRKLGLGDQWKTYQSYESGRTDPPQSIKDKLQKLGFEGSFGSIDRGPKSALAEIGLEYLAAPRITDMLPHHVAEAWAIVHEAARAGGADIMAMDVAAVGEILSTAAEAAAAGRGEEARLRAVRKAETILRAMGKTAT